MWSKTKSLLSLYEWSEIIEISPYLISQIGLPAESLSRALGQCQGAFYQNGSQSSDMLGREEVAQAIQDAEYMIAKVLNTFPAPMELSDTLQYPRPHNLKYWNTWEGISGRIKSVRTNYGGIISVGTYTETLIQANVAIVASNPYGDAFDTAWSTTVNVPAGTLESDIVVFFSSADRFNFDLKEMEIRPVKVSISGLVATITGHMTQLVTVDNYLKLVPEPLDANDAAIYATTIDVYARTIDTTDSGTIVWENPVWLDCTQYTPCEVALSTACFRATDARQGWLAPIPAQFDSDLDAYAIAYPDCIYYAPSRVQINYVSGFPLVNGRMFRPMAQAVAYLATALLPAREMGCSRADQRVFYYRQMPKDDDPENAGNIDVVPRTIEYANSMFGVSGRGAIRAAAILMDESYHIYRSAFA